LNFHLTTQEKRNIIGALDNSDNQQTFQEFTELAEKGGSSVDAKPPVGKGGSSVATPAGKGR
jgi:hypothetical protein